MLVLYYDITLAAVSPAGSVLNGESLQHGPLRNQPGCHHALVMGTGRLYWSLSANYLPPLPMPTRGFELAPFRTEKTGGRALYPLHHAGIDSMLKDWPTYCFIFNNNYSFFKKGKSVYFDACVV